MSFPADFTTYTVEGALSLCIAVLAYKIYKLRIATDSECCEGCIRIRTVSRGDSNTDLELPQREHATV
jgi:hypothetical protein